MKEIWSRLISRGRRLLERLWSPDSPPPLDPYVAVREPRRRPPGTRDAGVALEEPDEMPDAAAVGRDSDRFV